MKRQLAFPLPGVQGRVPIAVVGLGAIGREVARAVVSRGWPLVAAVDPAIADRDLAEVLGLPGLEHRVRSAIEKLPSGTVAIHTTGSFFLEVLPQLEELVWAGAHVVSSCEELAFPALRHPEEAGHLDRMATERHVVVAGLGVNPGFVLDALPALLATACRRVEGISLVRVVDTATRRAQLQRKTGAGMAPSAFEQAMREGRMGHIGLLESAALVAKALGWEVAGFDEEIAPVLAMRPLSWAEGIVQPGEVAGLHQRIEALSDRGTVVLDLTMALGAPEPRDACRIEGDPPMEWMSQGGVPGDVATVATLVNGVARVLQARPGLRTPLELPIA